MGLNPNVRNALRRGSKAAATSAKQAAAADPVRPKSVEQTVNTSVTQKAPDPVEQQVLDIGVSEQPMTRAELEENLAQLYAEQHRAPKVEAPEPVDNAGWAQRRGRDIDWLTSYIFHNMGKWLPRSDSDAWQDYGSARGARSRKMNPDQVIESAPDGVPPLTAGDL